ncbi:MAG TPA: hypothetical protein VF720_00960 [Candidatus Eisenbacteria bacterium]
MSRPIRPPGHEPEFSDPRLEAGLKSLTAGTTAPGHLVAAVERKARLHPAPVVHPWAERLPALASLGLVLSMLIGALTHLPVQRALAGLTGVTPSELGRSPMVVAGMVALALASLATIDWLRGAPVLRRFNR